MKLLTVFRFIFSLLFLGGIFISFVLFGFFGDNATKSEEYVFLTMLFSMLNVAGLLVLPWRYIIKSKWLTGLFVLFNICVAILPYVFNGYLKYLDSVKLGSGNWIYIFSFNEDPLFYIPILLLPALLLGLYFFIIQKTQPA